MNKKGTLVILNDLKNERDMVEKKYTEQKNKRFSDKQTLLYVAGFWLIFAGACLVCPTNMVASSLSLISYGLGVPCTYCYLKNSKEEKLRKQLDDIDRKMGNLILDLNSLSDNHYYDDKEKCFVYEGEVIMDKQNNISIQSHEEDCVQEGNNFVLKRKF